MKHFDDGENNLSEIYYASPVGGLHLDEMYDDNDPRFQDRKSISKWISVEDRPPEIIGDPNRGFLIVDAHGNIRLTRSLIEIRSKGKTLYFDDTHTECFWAIMGGEIPYCNTLIEGNEITHWMQLPEPPKAHFAGADKKEG